MQRLRIVPPPRTGLGVQWVGRAGVSSGALRIAVRPGVLRSVPDERLRPAAALKVRLTGRADASFVIEAYDLEGRRVGWPAVLDRDGVATVTGLPHGRVRVLAWSTRLRPFAQAWLGGSGFSSATPVPVRSGRTATVTLPVPAQAGAAPAGTRSLQAALRAGAGRTGAARAHPTGAAGAAVRGWTAAGLITSPFCWTGRARIVGRC